MYSFSRLILLTVSLFAVFVASAGAEFNIASFDGQIANQDGSAATQAGAHPYEISTTVTFPSHPDPEYSLPLPDEDVRNLMVSTPPGLIGNATATPERCDLADLVLRVCPVDSQVGVAVTKTVFGDLATSVYNVTAPPSVPAQFGFVVSSVPVLLTPSVRNGSDYGLTISARNVPQTIPVTGATVTFWGVPADPSHDFQRCGILDSFAEPPACEGETNDDRSFPHNARYAATPFLRNPTSCTPAGVGLEMSAIAETWQNPGARHVASFFTHLPAPHEATQIGTTGCDLVPFDPSISMAGDSGVAGGPSGLAVGVTMPQNENPTGLAQADLKKAVVTLPEGVTINPSTANGLGACSSAQIGLLGTNFPEPNPIHFNEAEPACPENSRIGTALIKTPLLKDPLEGAVYLAAQGDNPFGSLLAMYLVAKGPGVLLKVPGLIQADPNTGRLTATFDHNPQLPFSSLKLIFKEGPRAPLINPPTCGSYATSAAFSSWAQPENPVSRSASLQISSGADGGACAPLGFSPAFTGGTVGADAGAFSPLVLSFSRGDGEQTIRGLTATLPPGALAKLAGVALCADADANAGSCPAASQIGSVTVASGAGPTPFTLTGKVFLTGPYNGGPFGAVVVVPALAGPFNLGNVVVRNSIRIDEHTAQATIVSDAFPEFVNGSGIPADIRHVDVTLDRAGFSFNPTNCDALRMAGTLSSNQGVNAAISAPFQAVNCAKLPFKPKFTASTSARTSRAAGASLTVKIGYPKGSQANIRAVKVNLPPQLASRLTTLQQACLDTTFDRNPAACPAGSSVGVAKAVTPVLAKPLSGPAYFVSHGGAKFPELIIVLQGEGITVQLGGETFINSKGITSSTFRSVPDVPIGSFELNLPRGPHSVLGVGGKVDLCKTKLLMPTAITAQNGAVIRQSTKIAVSGCVKHKVKKTSAKAPRGKTK